MKNQLTDLENHLFHQIENLMHPVDGADISKEIEKSKAVSDLAGKILHSRKTKIDEARIEIDFRDQKIKIFEMAKEYGVKPNQVLEIGNEQDQE